MKGFALDLALKQRRKATRKSPIAFSPIHWSPDPLSSYPEVHSHLEPPIVLAQRPFWQYPGTSLHSLMSEIKKIKEIVQLSLIRPYKVC